MVTDHNPANSPNGADARGPLTRARRARLIWHVDAHRIADGELSMNHERASIGATAVLPVSKVGLRAPQPAEADGIGYEPVGVRHAARFGASGETQLARSLCELPVVHLQYLRGPRRVACSIGERLGVFAALDVGHDTPGRVGECAREIDTTPRALRFDGRLRRGVKQRYEIQVSRLNGVAV